MLPFLVINYCSICNLLILILFCSNFWIVQYSTYTSAKKYYPAYHKTKQYSEPQFYQTTSQFPVWNPVYHQQQQPPPLSSTQFRHPTYPNVQFKKRNYTYNDYYEENDEEEDDETVEDESSMEEASTTASTTTTTTTKKPDGKGTHRPPIGGLTLLLQGNPDAELSDEDKDAPPPFDFKHVELALIPAVKYEVHRMPKWFGATVQLSYPITFFFEQLDFPEDSSQPFPLGRRFFNMPMFSHKHLVPKRGKRSVNSNSILSLPPQKALRGGERTYIVPKLENLLRSTGINARACLLKTVCEIHQNQVHKNYGFLGELLTLLFSISNSRFSSTHLPTYLEAENVGRIGNCSVYSQRCPFSLFAFESEQQCEAGENCGNYKTDEAY